MTNQLSGKKYIGGKSQRLFPGGGRSQIDWQDHANSLEGQISETPGFNDAVVEVMDWVGAKRKRQKDTLVIVVADHDTGGFAVNGPYGALSEPGDLVGPGRTIGGHTAVDTIIYSQGPSSQMLNAALDNTDLYYMMKSVLR